MCRDHQVFIFVFEEANLWVRVVKSSCGLVKLVSLHVLFLREQVRDLRVQEFLRKLVVGVAVPSDLAGSIIVEILHSGEGGDVEQVCSNL